MRVLQGRVSMLLAQGSVRFGESVRPPICVAGASEIKSVGGLPHPSRAFCGRVGLRADYYLHECVKLVRYQYQGCLHFITFSCYRRMPLLDS